MNLTIDRWSTWLELLVALGDAAIISQLGDRLELVRDVAVARLGRTSADQRMTA